MHTHIIINHDAGLQVIVYSEESNPDLAEILDEMIVESLAHA
jgi:hypothetical protein